MDPVWVHTDPPIPPPHPGVYAPLTCRRPAPPQTYYLLHLSQRLEPKTFLASERTFLSWMHMAITLASIATALLAFAGSSKDKLDPLHKASCVRLAWGRWKLGRGPREESLRDCGGAALPEAWLPHTVLPQTNGPGGDPALAPLRKRALSYRQPSSSTLAVHSLEGPCSHQF